MKKFAFFLPQFHRIPENDKWWGTGFTEWTNVKKAKPLYRGHRQPKEPLGNNYYNLLNYDTVKWQTDLMKKYRIDGFIYYHYYFKGKLLLEQPAENLLKWKEIDQPFFFCWANHSWNKAWKNSREVLMEQAYGTEEDWEKHFQYLLPFFKDERYEKKDNMPIFMFFKSDFDEIDDVVSYFSKRCKENGFEGIYVIYTVSTYYNAKKIGRTSHGISFLREPLAALSLPRNILYKICKKAGKLLACCGVKAFVNRFNGNDLYDLMIKNVIMEKEKCENIYGAFFEWDNTPRHGSRGYIITPPDKSKFFKYMDTIKDSEYVFINAWNEWAEGMMLEPTKENGYKYLEWVQEWSMKNDCRFDGV